MRLTTEIFKNRIFELEGCNYELLSEYINNKTKVKIKHTICGMLYETTPNHFLRGGRCPKCSGKMKKNTEQFKKEVFDLVNDEYDVLDEYINTNTKIKIRHNECNNILEIRPNQFLSGNRCSYCYGNRKKDTGQFKKEVFKLVQDNYSVLGEYIGANIKIKMKHNECEHVYKIKPTTFLRGHGCPKCYGKHKKTDDQFKTEVLELVGDEYEVLDKYCRTNAKLKIRHNKCNNVYEVRPYSFIRGDRCPYCAGNIRKTTEQFKNELYELVGDEYFVLGNYINIETKIKMKHNICGFIWDVIPKSVLTGHGCPKCASSKSENIIDKFMSMNNISFKRQYKFTDCKNKYPLPFDFYIENILLIEFDGKQHFKSVDYFGGEEGFRKRKENDVIKNKYCIGNNIPLIRIPYWEKDNLEYILGNVLTYFDIPILNNNINKEIVERYLVHNKWNHNTYLSWDYKENRY